MNQSTLVVGMPAGSLADPNRGGNLVSLLKSAGFPTKGYDQGGPTHFPLTSFLVGWDGRPQEFGAQLALGELDVAIAGDDWIKERVLEYRYAFDQDIQLDKVLSLKRGGVRIVTIVNPLGDESFDEWFRALLLRKPVVQMVAELPYLALDWFRTKKAALGLGDSHNTWRVQKYKAPATLDDGLVIYEAWGKTEAKVKSGAVDLGIEITQSGSALRNYGLAIGEDVMRSETGIWVNPAIRKDPAKYDLARMFLLNLYGSIYAENKVLLFFNARKEQVPAIIAYLSRNQLFGDEPTINEGVNFTEFSVQMDMANPALPLAQVRYELAKTGASHIETVPLDSCIPGIDAIDF